MNECEMVVVVCCLRKAEEKEEASFGRLKTGPVVV